MNNTVLTDEQIISIMAQNINHDNDDMRVKPMSFARAIEQAVLQSPEIRDLRQRVEAMEKIVAECRDAMPIPNVGSKAEILWPDAMSDAASVPDFIKASIESLREDAERINWIESRYGADIVCMDTEQWEVSSTDAFGEGLILRDAIDAAMEKQP